MTQIKKILDKQGEEVFIRTSTKAVVDDNGYTAESRLQAMQDEINQAQLEVGAVPSDLTPTEDSTNWVTSGGIYNQLNVGDANVEIDLSDYTAVRAFPTPNTWTVTNDAYQYYGIFIPITPGKYRVVANESEHYYYFAFLKNNTYSQNAAVDYATGCTRVTMNANEQVIATAPADANYLYVATYTTADITPKKVERYNKRNIAEVLANIDSVPTEGSTELVESGGVYNALQSVVEDSLSAISDMESEIDYITEKEIFGVSEATTGQTDSSIITCTLDNNVIKFVATGAVTSKKYAWVNIPNNVFASNEKYKLIFDYTANIDSSKDGWISLASNTGQGGFVAAWGVNLASGEGHVEIPFTWTDQICFKTSSSSIGASGKYVYLSNFRVIKYDDETYSTIPQLEQKVNEILDTYNNIPSDVPSHTYNGAAIPPLKQNGKIGCKKLMDNVSCQAGAAYGGYYFQFTNQHASLRIYDLTTNTSHSSVTMTSKSSDHCNNVCFSNIFYDVNDTFPLIYTSGSQTGTYNHVQVWRIQLESNVFSITQVQEITLPTGDGTNWMWGQAYLDNEFGYMWYSTNGTLATYYKFAIPSIFSDNEVVSEVTLTANDAIDSFTIERNRNQQGGVVKNGTLYLLDGVPSYGTLTRLYVVDLWGKSLINIIDIYNILGVTSEFEGCGIYNDTLIANTNGGGIYAIYF